MAYVSGYSVAVVDCCSRGWQGPKPVKTYFMSPELFVDGPSCLKFWYTQGSCLEVKWISELDTKTLAMFMVDGGNQFHEAFIELPLGKFRLVFEVIITGSPDDCSTCIDDIRVNPQSCSYASKSEIRYIISCKQACYNHTEG